MGLLLLLLLLLGGWWLEAVAGARLWVVAHAGAACVRAGLLLHRQVDFFAHEMLLGGWVARAADQLVRVVVP